MSSARPVDPILAERLASQLLSGPPAADPLAVARHLLAVQGQDPRAARLAMRVRSQAQRATDVDRALSEERSLIITWVNRGTLHLIAAEDEPLLHLLTTPQLRSANNRRLEQEGVSPAQAARGAELIAGALGDRGPQTRAQLRELLERADIPVARSQAFVHILFHATLNGTIVRGPMLGTEHAFVLAEEWLGPRPRLDRDRALAELARRYLRGHAPASERDLAKWAQLPLCDVRRALGAIAREITTDADGLHRLDSAGPTAETPLPPPRLLGPFDPLLLGWADRSFVLPDPSHVVTTNGIFRAIVLIDGQAAGTWTLPGGRPRLDLWDGDPDDGDSRAALEREAAAVTRYLGR